MLRLKEDEILARGVIKNVPLVLDDSEDHEAAGHWLNTTGCRVYDKTRVEVAESLIQNFNGRAYVSQDATSLNDSEFPVTPAILIFDYRTILKALDEELSREIRRTRLSHPYVGRMPGSENNEVELIKEALVMVAQYAYPEASIHSFNDVEQYMETVAECATDTLCPFWPNILLRKPKLGYNTSRGKSRNAARQVFSIISLIHTNKINYDCISPVKLGVASLLSAAPVLRIDHQIQMP